MTHASRRREDNAGDEIRTFLLRHDLEPSWAARWTKNT
jgi:hypothetical protein